MYPRDLISTRIFYAKYMHHRTLVSGVWENGFKMFAKQFWISDFVPLTQNKFEIPFSTQLIPDWEIKTVGQTKLIDQVIR